MMRWVMLALIIVGLVLTSPLYYWLATRDSAYRRRQTGAHLPPSAAR